MKFHCIFAHPVMLKTHRIQRRLIINKPKTDTTSLHKILRKNQKKKKKDHGYKQVIQRSTQLAVQSSTLLMDKQIWIKIKCTFLQD